VKFRSQTIVFLLATRVAGVKGLVLVAAFLTMISEATHAFDMGPLKQFLEPGSSGAWTLTEQNGAAVFDNRESDGDINYYYVGPNPGEEGRREISVNLGLLRRSGFSKAGLLYGFESDPRSYFMFTVDGEATLRLEYRSPTGWEERMSSSLSGLSPDNISLAIREDGNQISLLVNGQERTAIGNDRIGRGGVGIVTVGIGTYRFHGFNVTVRDAKANSPQQNDTIQQPDGDSSSLTTQSPSTVASAQNSIGDFPDGVLHVKPVEIIDKNGFEKPIRAASLLIPADWKFKGQVQWIMNGCFKGTHIVYDAISPDERSNISLLPMTSAQWSQLGPINNCTFLRAVRAEDMLQPVIDPLMKKATILKTERNPELTALTQQWAFQDTGLRSWMDHIVATVEHDRNGERNRATMLLYTWHMQMISPMLNGPAESMIASALPIVFSAPVEHFDHYEVAQTLITATYNIDSNWQAQMNKHRRIIAEDNRRTSAKIAEINRNANAEIAAINSATQASVSASNDRSNRRVLEMLTETQHVQGSNGPVRVPAGTVWQTQDGSMFVSQDSSFDPNSVGATAKKLTPIR